MVIILCATVYSAFAQTNVVVLPYAGPDVPSGRDAIWLALVPPVSGLIVWAVGKIPKLPKVFLPFLTPFAGILIGAVLKWGAGAGLPWWSVAGAGAIATTLYEAIKGVTGAGPESKLTPTPTPPPSS